MKILLFILCFISIVADAQVAKSSSDAEYDIVDKEGLINNASSYYRGRKLYQVNSGMIMGLQKGKYTSFELGGEAHWRKISLLKPRIVGATANMEYNFSDNVIGYKAGLWMKRGWINLTYGINASYFTNFKSSNSFGFGPSVGFRLLGFHLINGYNFLLNNSTTSTTTPVQANSIYLSLRYYVPVHNKFTWDRKTMKKKRERKKEREKRKKERQEKRESGESKSFFDIFKKGKKDGE
jgi:hypothetical protein